MKYPRSASESRSLSLLLAAGLTAVGSVPALAQSQAAVIDAAHADADFNLQGEYVGCSYLHRAVGLQVVALGGGQFDAVSFRGGLPGAGWDHSARSKFSGSLQNGSLVLSGPSGRFAIAGGWAIAQDASGREIGRLNKIERQSPTLGWRPPSRATVLFDGQQPEYLQGAKITPEGLLLAGVLTKMPVGAFRLHLEFRTPYMPQARGQARGNSGVYIQQRYEVQILDSFGLDGAPNECGGLYRQTRPDVNMCLPPLAWQTYDIWFTPPRFDTAGAKIANARITVLHNGVPIHYHRQITAKTGGGKPEGPEPFPINLQDHGNPVTFRNLWMVMGEGDECFGSLRPEARYKRGWLRCGKRRK